MRTVCVAVLFRLALALAALVLSLALPQSVWAQANLENPQNNSFQSGIGTISGWVCSANRIDLQINGSITVQAPYGSLRGDTQGECGDANNGFGYLVNWSGLGPGQHTLVALADGVEFGRATFTISTFGVPFVTGASGTYTVPFNGRNVTIQWQESLQNFVITGTSGGGSGPFSGTYHISATKTSDTCGIPPTGLTDTLTVTQNGSNLTGTLPPDLQYSGTVEPSGNFTLTQTNPTQGTAGYCIFEVGGSLSGNFNSGSVVVTFSRRPVSGSCPSTVNCDALFSGTLTKTSSAQQETSEYMLFGEDEGSSVDELIDSLFVD